ncbi:hypothetical protein G6O69_35160 [Pseudenhygromyxa sp. WMMC2535]|uniref:hypothetical protein n=1 Tax=Pseudenhygromyxa sp. WMMC2535 TaxID=2712867 RepID=UPI00155414D2|nr:hypothetical protein [Pseudenhygromyxa sp. WMMC2535]NVB43116.1 hypothetical protein [Pseudenhygromyxa sp. WMMC2535]
MDEAQKLEGLWPSLPSVSTLRRSKPAEAKQASLVGVQFQFERVQSRAQSVLEPFRIRLALEA